MLKNQSHVILHFFINKIIKFYYETTIIVLFISKCQMQFLPKIVFVKIPFVLKYNKYNLDFLTIITTHVIIEKDINVEDHVEYVQHKLLIG